MFTVFAEISDHADIPNLQFIQAASLRHNRSKRMRKPFLLWP